jgi:hypothetical protein
MRAKIFTAPGTRQDWPDRRACAHFVEIGIVDAAFDALALQRRRRLVRMVGMGQRHLQQGEDVFHAVIGRQRRIERGRGLQFLRADRGQNLGLHGRSCCWKTGG